MTGQHHLSQYNIGDSVHHESMVKEDGTPKKGVVVQYRTSRFGVSKVVNAMGLKPGIYCLNDGLLVDWGDGVPVFHDALELELVRPEFLQKTRLTKARVEALEKPIFIGDLPVLKVDIGDWVKIDGDSDHIGLLIDIDYMAALEKNIHTAEARPCYRVHDFKESKILDLYPHQIDVIKRGAWYSYLTDMESYDFISREEYILFEETSGITTGDSPETFFLDGRKRLVFRSDRKQAA